MNDTEAWVRIFEATIATAKSTVESVAYTDAVFGSMKKTVDPINNHSQSRGSKMDRPGIYWNGTTLDFGFWILQRSGKLYFSGTPVKSSKWSLAEPQDVSQLHYLCDLNGNFNADSALNKEER